MPPLRSAVRGVQRDSQQLHRVHRRPQARCRGLRRAHGRQYRRGRSAEPAGARQAGGPGKAAGWDRLGRGIPHQHGHPLHATLAVRTQRDPRGAIARCADRADSGAGHQRECVQRERRSDTVPMRARGHVHSQLQWRDDRTDRRARRERDHQGQAGGSRDGGYRRGGAHRVASARRATNVRLARRGCPEQRGRRVRRVAATGDHLHERGTAAQPPSLAAAVGR